MFVGRPAAGRGMGRVGEYVNRPWKEDDWIYLARQKAAGGSIIPGVSNTTAAVAGGGLALAAAAALAWYLMK